MSTNLMLDKTVPMQLWRKADSNVPPTLEQRNFIKKKAAEFVVNKNLVPPMPLSELEVHAGILLEEEGIEKDFLNFTAVILNNAAWEDHLAGIPYERRLLMMPKCLRKEAHCPAPFDEFGLLCKQCGQCSLQDLQEEAERLGYAVLIAEGSALVTAIIETGKIDAIVGVSCLSVLEKAFPFMEAASIPGIAIPLLQGDCIDTNVDLDWVWDVIHLTSEDETRRMNLDALRKEVQTWFEPESLADLMGEPSDETTALGQAWLAEAGKRWRPFLAACAWRALQEDIEAPFPRGFKKLAIAVECFHKASLIHDDIEDDDDTRYGKATMHAEHGLPIALNVGDLLIGEGYRLIAESEASPSAMASLIRIAAEGQRQLCIGQGAELHWMREPNVLHPSDVVEIFARKTAPAFEVALQLGAAYAGAGDDIGAVLTEYSQALGIAYQIQDDLDDAKENEDPNDIEALRPSLLLALAHHNSKGDDKTFLGKLWQRQPEQPNWSSRVREIYETKEIPAKAENLLDSYKERAVTSLKELQNANLKGLLRRVVGKIFNRVEIKEWCREFETRDVASRETGTPIVV